MAVSPDCDFVALVSANRARRAAQPVPASRPKFEGISAAEFLQRCNQTRSRETVIEAVIAYTGEYNIGLPFGTQYDNARMRAREALRSSIMPERSQARIPRMPNLPGRVAEALTLGLDAKRRYEIIVAGDAKTRATIVSPDASPEAVEALKATYSEQLERAGMVLGAYLQSQGIELN